MTELICLFAAGAAGAIIKDVVVDGKLVLPKKVDGTLILGFLGGVATGGAAGVAVDHSPITAFLAGYAGTSAIENLLNKTEKITVDVKEINKNIIKRVAKEEGVDPELALKVAKCESNFDHRAKNVNEGGSIDRGLFQINTKYHPEVSDDEAYNPITATKFFCKAFKEGNLYWWNASKDCWNK
jgi:hypothetical protein